MTARRCKAGDLFAKPLALPVPVVASGLDGKMCSTPAGMLGWLHDTRDQLRPQYVLSQGPRLLNGPPCFSFSSLEPTDELRCAALRCTQGTWTQGSNVWQAKGLNVHFSPGLAKEDAGVVPGCLGV